MNAMLTVHRLEDFVERLFRGSASDITSAG
jgi:hypothetical protein